MPRSLDGLEANVRALKAALAGKSEECNELIGRRAAYTVAADKQMNDRTREVVGLREQVADKDRQLKAAVEALEKIAEFSGCAGDCDGNCIGIAEAALRDAKGGT